MSLGKPRKRSARDDESLEELFGVEPFHRNEITLTEINRLRSWIDERGAGPVADDLGIADSTLLFVTSGFGHRLQPKTAERVRNFLRKK
jgi:hypothetical protein